MAEIFGFLILFGGIGWLLDQIDFESIGRALKLRRMNAEERQSFLAAEVEAVRLEEIRRREQLYAAAIEGPQKWCLMAMREGRNYTRQWVAKNDMDDIQAWAAANGIAITRMEDSGEQYKLSFGELRRAKKTARFMGEPI